MSVQEYTAEIKPGEATMTFEEFLAWANEDTLAEWVDGRVVMYSPASYEHQDMAAWLTTLLRLFVEARDLGKVLSAPMQMKLEHSSREPDVLFLTEAHLGRLKDVYLDGPADVVVEIASASTASIDRGEKFHEYEAAGIPEYWLINPRRRRAELYRLDADGVYQTLLPDEGIFRSEVIAGFWLRVDWLWQEPLPKVNTALYEIFGLPAWFGDAVARAARSGEVPPELALLDEHGEENPEH